MTECADGTPEETPHDQDDDADPQPQDSAVELDAVDEQLAAQLIAGQTHMVDPKVLAPVLQRFFGQ